jgi:FkbM family methyltransferase
MKIDVQGAEERVMIGAKETIERDHPAILIEMDDEALRPMG